MNHTRKVKSKGCVGLQATADSDTSPLGGKEVLNKGRDPGDRFSSGLDVSMKEAVEGKPSIHQVGSAKIELGKRSLRPHGLGWDNSQGTGRGCLKPHGLRLGKGSRGETLRPTAAQGGKEVLNKGRDPGDRFSSGTGCTERYTPRLVQFSEACKWRQRRHELKE